jgi:hypothetical protein
MDTNVFPMLVAKAILYQHCHTSVAARVFEALCELPERESTVLWLRMQGRSYSDIGALLEMNKGMVWKIIHGPVRRSVYSIIERSTAIPVTAGVS